MASGQEDEGVANRKSGTYIIPGLLAAGISFPAAANHVSPPSVNRSERDDVDDELAVALLRQEPPVELAGHSSHRSHSSHSSHRSSSGGGYYSPAPLYSPPPPPPRAVPKFRAPETLFTIPQVVEPDASPFIVIVKRVQLGLKSFGYYSGVIDGDIGPETKAAILKMQGDFNLKQTGTITPEVLKSLGISF
jgi:His-Xaa-Ser repeat protein HxsA